MVEVIRHMVYCRFQLSKTLQNFFSIHHLISMMMFNYGDIVEVERSIKEKGRFES